MWCMYSILCHTLKRNPNNFTLISNHTRELSLSHTLLRYDAYCNNTYMTLYGRHFAPSGRTGDSGKRFGANAGATAAAMTMVVMRRHRRRHRRSFVVSI